MVSMRRKIKRKQLERDSDRRMFVICSAGWIAVFYGIVIILKIKDREAGFMRFLNELHEGDRINGIYLC